MSVHIKEITKENWREIVALKVSCEQQKFVETVPYCLAESFIEQFTTSLGLYDEDTPVGYAMVGFHSVEKKSVWFDRFMIDEKYQGKGYAHQFIPLILQYIKGTYQIEKIEIIKLSIIPSNQVARRLYEKHGFQLTGDKDPEGELIMELRIKKETNISDESNKL